MFTEAGLPWTSDIERVPSSRLALQLGELARDRGAYPALHHRLFDAYWARALDLGDVEVLVGEARGVGLDEGEVRTALADGRYEERLRRETARAVSVGAGGVPAWVLDDRVLVPGAQPHAVFERVLRRLGHEPRTDA